MSLSLNFISNSDNRLDVAIFEILQGIISRSQVQKYISEQGVNVGSERVFKHGYKLMQGLSVKFDWLEPSQELDVDLISKIKVEVQTADYLLINKPPGLVVHAGAGHSGDTLADWLTANYSEQAQMQGGDPEDTHDSPHLGGGMVHRLDKDTQGLMLIARNFKTLRFFQEQFKSRQVKKKYLALLSGKLEQKASLKGFQIRTRRNVLKQYFTLQDIEQAVVAEKIAKMIPLKGDWRTSESDFTPLFYSPELDQTIAEVQIFTGRMHQIRTQAEFIGFPVIHDPLYKIINSVNLLDLASKNPQRLTLENVTVETLNKAEFLDKQQQIFGFLERHSFFLKAYSLEVLLPDGSLGSFKC